MLDLGAEVINFCYFLSQVANPMVGDLLLNKDKINFEKCVL